jgi:uncharacterized protein
MSSVQQPLEYVSRASRLDRILRELLHQTPGVEAAAVVSFDGLPMASALPPGMDEDRVAAMSAALLSLAERAAQGLGRGDLSQVYIEGENGTVFLVSAQDEAVLIAVTAADAKVGMMLYEVKLAASRVGEVLRGPVPLPAPLPSHVTRGYLDAHDNGVNGNGSSGVPSSYGGYSAQPEVYETTAADASLADLPYSESSYGDATYDDGTDSSPLYSELTHAEPAYTEPSYDEYTASNEAVEPVEATDVAEPAADSDSAPVDAVSVDGESADAATETADNAAAAADVDNPATDDATDDAHDAHDADDENEDDESDEVYPDRVYTEVVYTEASLTQPTSTDEGADEKADDSHEEPHNDAAPSTPSYGEPSYYAEPPYYAEPAAAPAAPPAEQPGWSSYAPSGSVLPGGQAWS